MTWQEELRKLDEDFSSGTITADEYRVRRDQVLSSAVAPPQESTEEDGNLEATQIVRPAQPPQPPQPPRPPQNAPQPPPPPTAAESTQIVSSSDNPDATQIVRNAAGQSDPTPQYQVPDADRTQAVPHWQTQQAAQQDMYPPAQQYGPPSGGFPQQQPHHSPPPPQQWHNARTQDEAAPLWGGDEFPPLAPQSEPDWVTQGPEFAKDPEEKGSTGKIVGAVLAVLLLAGIAFGAYMLWGRGGDEDPQAGPNGGEPTSQQPAPSTTSAPPSTPVEPVDPLRIAELPGEAEEHPEVTTFSDMEAKNYFNKKELKAYDRAGVGETKFHVQRGDYGDVVIVLASVDSGKKGTAAVKQLRKIQIDNGSKAFKNAPDNVQVTENTQDKKRPEIRAHYLSGNIIVRLELRSEKSLKAARDAFDEVLNAQLQELPADGS